MENTKLRSFFYSLLSNVKYIPNSFHLIFFFFFLIVFLIVNLLTLCTSEILPFQKIYTKYQ